MRAVWHQQDTILPSCPQYEILLRSCHIVYVDRSPELPNRFTALLSCRFSRFCIQIGTELGRCSRGKANAKNDYKERIYLAQDRDQWWAVLNTVASLRGFKKLREFGAFTQRVVVIPYRRFGTTCHLEGSRIREFLCNLIVCWLLRKDSAAWSCWSLLICTLFVAGWRSKV